MGPASTQLPPLSGLLVLGLNPAEVRRFLHRVALDLTALHHDLAQPSEENARMKRALRARQGAWSERRRP